MPSYIDIFVSPIRDNKTAQALVIALLILTALDLLFGVFNAMFFQNNFSSHELRKGLLRKLGNFGMLCVAVVIDGILLSGFDLGFQPIFVTLAGAFCLMEIGSVIELWADAHPECKGTGVWKLLENAKKGHDQPDHMGGEDA